MDRQAKIVRWAMCGSLVFGLAACATGGLTQEEAAKQQQEIEQLKQSISERDAALQQTQAEVTKLSAELAQKTVAAPAAVSAAPPVTTAGAELFPPNARAGECYARVFVPASYQTSTEQVLKREASQRVEIIPARYETVTEQVLVSEASSRLEQVPAVYETVSEIVTLEPETLVWRTTSSAKSKLAPAALVAAAVGQGVPAGASAGECFAEYREAARYEKREEQVLKREASQRIEVVPAQYEMVEERVLVSQASSRLEQVPAVYETVSEQVIDRPAHTVWKKGRGPIERIDNATGEIMCLVEVPATYKTVTKRVLKTPATTRTVEIPAKYETVKVRKLKAAAGERKIDIPAEYQSVAKRVKVADERVNWRAKGSDGPGKATGRQICRHPVAAKTKSVQKRVLKSPAATRTIEIPAKYKTVKVRKQVEAAREKRIEIPAEYQTVTHRKLVKDGQMEWREILCETNMSAGLVRRVQTALDNAGHSPGGIDGVYGRDTLAAVVAFQKAKGLPSGSLTLRTLKELGVQP